MATIQEGRQALAEVLDREADDAKSALLRGIATAKAGLADAEAGIAAGLGLATTTTGEALVLPSGENEVNRLGTEWMAAERRKSHLLALYDRVNGTEGN